MLFAERGEESLGGLGPQILRLVNRRPRFGEAAEFGERHRGQDPARSVRRVELAGALESGERRLEAPLAKEDIPERGVGLRLLGPGLEGRAELVLRRREIPLASAEHAQAEPGQRLSRVERDRVR